MEIFPILGNLKECMSTYWGLIWKSDFVQLPSWVSRTGVYAAYP